MSSEGVRGWKNETEMKRCGSWIPVFLKTTFRTVSTPKLPSYCGLNVGNIRGRINFHRFCQNCKSRVGIANNNLLYVRCVVNVN